MALNYPKNFVFWR